MLDITKPMHNKRGAQVVHAEPTDRGYYMTFRYPDGFVTGYCVTKEGDASSWPTDLDVVNPPPTVVVRVYRKKNASGGWCFMAGEYPNERTPLPRPSDPAWEEIHSMEVASA